MVAIIRFLYIAYSWMLVIRVVGSWFPEWQRTFLMQLIFRLTEPYLQVFRHLVPPIGGIDISPILAFLVLGLVQKVLISLFL